MRVQELDNFMSDVRNELTQITLDLAQMTSTTADINFALQMRQTHLLTQLQHMETLRWFSSPSLNSEIYNPAEMSTAA